MYSPPTLEQLGPYRILELLGSGGFGRVFRAQHEMLKREVALKVLRGDVDELRFLREAQILAQLDHPNIVGIHDCGRAPDGTYFIALELLHGENLLDRIKYGAIPPEESVWIVSEMLHGLGHAHAAGVVHRDVKPSNILLVPASAESRTVHVKLLDFGVSLLADRTRLTVTRGAIGTPRYLAPELLHGHDSDERSDVWAAGITLVECLRGRPAYLGDATTVLPQILAGPPELPDPSAIGAPLHAVLQRMLAPREHRIASASEARAAILATAKGSPIARDTLGPLSIQGTGSFALDDFVEFDTAPARPSAVAPPSVPTTASAPGAPPPGAEQRRSSRTLLVLAALLIGFLLTAVAGVAFLLHERGAATERASATAAAPAMPEPAPAPAPAASPPAAPEPAVANDKPPVAELPTGALPPEPEPEPEPEPAPRMRTARRASPPRMVSFPAIAPRVNAARWGNAACQGTAPERTLGVWTQIFFGVSNSLCETSNQQLRVDASGDGRAFLTHHASPGVWPALQRARAPVPDGRLTCIVRCPQTD